MRVNLNREKLQRLHELVEYLLKEFPASDKAEELVDALIHKIRIKLRNRLDTYNVKNSYSITLPKEEALAYFIWMEQVSKLLPKNVFVFELNVSLTITNEIDRTYGTINAARPTAGLLASSH
ncbi:MAG: hypothetical protein V4663_06105 [Bacteroidota bacterium]